MTHCDECQDTSERIFIQLNPTKKISCIVRGGNIRASARAETLAFSVAAALLSIIKPVQANVFAASNMSYIGQIVKKANAVTLGSAVALADAETVLSRPFDIIPTGAISGFAFRKLWSGYNGACCRVRRGDGTEQDIGFDASGRFDLVAFQGFIGGSIGTCARWYDQRGGNDHAHALPPNQPQILAIGGRATLVFNGSQELYRAGNFLSGVGEMTLFTVATNKNSVNLREVFSASTTAGADSFGVKFGHAAGVAKLLIQVPGTGSTQLGSVMTVDEKTLWTIVKSATEKTLYKNTAIDVTSPQVGQIDYAGVTQTRIGASISTTGNSRYWDGYISEVLIYNRACSPAELAIMQNNINLNT